MASFWISRLRIVGQKVKQAEVSFGPHLNVISGASDTGKSYILACINYMFGAEEPPKSIKQNAGYDTILLELETSSKKRFVLQRSLKQGKDFLVFEQNLDNWDGTGGEFLRWKHSGGATDTVSHFLLGLCGLGDVTIATSKIKTRQLSFRDISRFCVIGETAIIHEDSPVFPSRQLIQKTADKSVFDFLLSGEDSRSVIVAPDPKIRKASWRAKDELYSQLISEIEVEVPHTVETSQTRLESIDAEIDGVTSVIADDNNLIATVQAQRSQEWQEWHIANSRKSAVTQLLFRFDLLKKHYYSDIERLEFLSEADHYLSQVGSAVHCPVCGALIEDHKDEDHAGVEVKAEIKNAARIEAGKLQTLLGDLDVTLEALKKEEAELETAILESREKINDSDKRLKQELLPRMQIAKSALQKLLDDRKNTLAELSAHARIQSLSEQRKLLGPEPKQTKSKSSTAEIAGESVSRRQFLNKLQAMLVAWKYSPVDIAEFNEKMELIVAGETRKSHGKGIRAILQSAFTATLMLHAWERHPGLVVLDSPLTSFREADSYEADKDVQRGFFEYLIGSQKGQVIVLENKEPAADLVARMHYEHFSGATGEGRRGFYPT